MKSQKNGLKLFELVLDETTSAVDLEENEMKIKQKICHGMEGNG